MLSWKKPITQRAGGVIQGIGPEFIPQVSPPQKKKKVMYNEYMVILLQRA
jgi:hypothetical protein